jgi:F0F1-type ATP synthase assembly protein I
MSSNVNWMRTYARVSGAVMVKVCLLAAAFLIGSRLDARFHTYPWLLMLCLVVAASVGIWWIVRVASQVSSD